MICIMIKIFFSFLFKKCITFLSLSDSSIGVKELFSLVGVTPVDGMPGQPYSSCYPVILDGTMVGWVEKDLAPSMVESLRKFKVRHTCTVYGNVFF